MYITVDVGGTKTLVAVMNDQGKILNKVRFETPEDYTDFISQIRKRHDEFGVNPQALGAGIAGRLDREHGIGVRFGNIGWKNVPIKEDLGKVFGCPVAIENDAKAAGLFEALLLKDEFGKVLYITIGTGIGIAYVVDGEIDTELGDRGGNQFIIEYKGKETTWEKIASGSAIVERFGRKAKDIHDKATWKQISRDLAIGLLELTGLLEVEVIVFGGGVGVHFKRFKDLLESELKNNVDLPIPELRQAQQPEEAVLLGCYELAKSLIKKTHEV